MQIYNVPFKITNLMVFFPQILMNQICESLCISSIWYHFEDLVACEIQIDFKIFSFEAAKIWVTIFDIILFGTAIIHIFFNIHILVFVGLKQDEPAYIEMYGLPVYDQSN